MSKFNSITLAILSVLATSHTWAKGETFNTNFMIGGLNGEKISNYHIDSDKPMPGIYAMDVYLNNQWRGHYDIDIKDDPNATCLSMEQLKQIGILTEGISIDKGVECVPLRDAVQGGSVDYDIGHFNLKLSVPQAYVLEYEHGYVPPEAWDRGINALYTSYYASQYYSDYKNGGDDKSSYLNLNSGLNLLGWQLHSNANYTKSDENSGKWKSNTLYLERGIPQILGTFRAGEMYTGSDVFDSVRFRGVRLWRDMQMLPNSKQNFTPVVRGVAQSNALVTIEQNGFVVYQKEVPPGPFAIDDLQLSNGGADLEVIVKEADGSTSYYRVPYSSVPNMLQPGVSKYEFSAGRSHIEGASNQSDFIQGSYKHGFNNLLTGYGGTLLSDNYSSFVLGTGWNTPIGAISVDFTHSYSKQDNGDVFNGQSYQIAWNKYLSQSGTQFSLAAWRYSSRGYRTFNDHVWANNKNRYNREDNSGYDIANYYQYDFGRKNSFSLNINQSLPENWGYLAISGQWRDYWERSGTGKNYQLSYTNSWERLSYTLSVSQTYDEDNSEDRRINLFFSIPFSWRDNITEKRRDLFISNSTTFDKDGYQSNTTSLSGVAGNRDQFSYGANFSHQQQDSEATAGGNLIWRAPVATIGGSYSQSKKYQQISGNIQGGLVAWSDGIALAPRLSDTFTIVHAPGLDGAAVQGYRYLSTDSRGYAIYDSLTPYRKNTLMLDTSDSQSDVALLGNRKSTAPYRGAVVMTQFDTDKRKPWYFLAQRPDGSPLSFGYEVEDESGKNVGLVGQGSRIFIRTDDVPASIRVSVNKQQEKFCTITFDNVIDENKVYICR
ncbi:fimbrial biogenesis outer membrane usher protein [Escherichia coli]|uniref:fimbrial biogenesis outer membrane usher protein n=2 Tax=Escherichia coli TaxID=562 RepID=UPI00164F0380|nr:fimbrial biogenesis outer membrane usher protein [Escherichia coli]EFB8894413.1 fimbrial biogenesis outer membrane usher protein [Escherichia coli]EFO2702042.1 fimbrial biogenesis outer membrane usher protein [Escherichia coli]EFO2714708.1 fimbrial biogenesis outer membrane usher protein [Escherichia coli]EGS5084024.1 fimbria/pilus outer membrane usher protein [Escherichia coli]EMB6779050.1 fimbria/pilus outer membrane usher protein [Escherichia coli]